jgi:NAD(P)H dehydrogenase (quinone)
LLDREHDLDVVALTRRPDAIQRTAVTVELTGPAALTAAEICHITQLATGRELRYVALDDASYRARMARERAPNWLIEAYSTMFESVRA